MCKVFDAGKSITRGGPWTLIRDIFGQNITMAQLVKRSPMSVKVLGSILALILFLPESKTSPSSILTNLGC